MKQSKRGGLVLSLFVIWLAALFRITVFRDGCFSHGLCSGRVEWVPFLYLAKLLRIGYYRYFCYLFFGNLIWFVPAALLCLLGVSRLRAICFAFALSVLIETLQYLLGSGVTEVEDVILNTLGAALGTLLIPRKKDCAAGRNMV